MALFLSKVFWLVTAVDPQHILSKKDFHHYENSSPVMDFEHFIGKLNNSASALKESKKFEHLLTFVIEAVESTEAILVNYIKLMMSKIDEPLSIDLRRELIEFEQRIYDQIDREGKFLSKFEILKENYDVIISPIIEEYIDNDGEWRAKFDEVWENRYNDSIARYHFRVSLRNKDMQFNEIEFNLNKRISEFEENLRMLRKVKNELLAISGKVGGLKLLGEKSEVLSETHSFKKHLKELVTKGHVKDAIEMTLEYASFYSLDSDIKRELALLAFRYNTIVQNKRLNIKETSTDLNKLTLDFLDFVESIG